MTRRRDRDLEQLEGRTLLSSVPDNSLTNNVVSPPSMVELPIAILPVDPPLYPSTSPQPGLSSRLTTDQPVYQVGEPIQLTLTETNNTDEPITVFLGPGLDGLAIQHDNVTVWDSDTGLCCICLWIGSETLQPGQSLTRTATWNGIPNEVPPSILSGSFTVTSDGASATFQIASPPAAQLATTVTTDRSVYRAGQPIQMTFTETNTGDQPTTVLVGGGFDVTQDGSEVWSSEYPGWITEPLIYAVDTGPGIHPDIDFPPRFQSIAFGPYGQDYHWETLQPGQSYTDTASWYGVPQGGLFVQSGTFVVSHAGDPQQSTATFQLVNPITYSVTTDQSTYRVGEPVQITLTETNTGDQPVTIDPSLLSAGITHDGNWIWGDSSWCVAPRTVTLQPGQSYSKTETWDGIASNYPLNPSGTFVVSFVGTSQQATFQVADPQLVYSLTTDKSLYNSGEPVQITFNETDTGDQPVTIAPSLVMFNLMQDGNWVWGSGYAWPCDQATVTLQPGQSYSKTVTWYDLPDGVPYGGAVNPSGTFVVTVPGTGQQATFQVADPQLAYSLTTDKSVYNSGEPVQITLTETNNGDQPVTFAPDLVGFHITLEGFQIWSSSSWCWDPTTVTLQPGGSYSTTVTWDGDTESIWQGVPPGALGTAVVSVDGISQQATFEIVAASSVPSSDRSGTTVTPGDAPPPSTNVASPVKSGSAVGPTTTPASIASEPAPQGITVLVGPNVVWRSSRSVLAWSARSLEPAQRLPHPTGSHTRPHQQDLKKAGPGTHNLLDHHGGILESAKADLAGMAIDRLPGGPLRAGKPNR